MKHSDFEDYLLNKQINCVIYIDDVVPSGVATTVAYGDWGPTGFIHVYTLNDGYFHIDCGMSNDGYFHIDSKEEFPYVKKIQKGVTVFSGMAFCPKRTLREFASEAVRWDYNLLFLNWKEDGSPWVSLDCPMLVMNPIDKEDCAIVQDERENENVDV